KWLIGRDLLGVGDHRLGLGDEIRRQVIALFRGLWSLDLHIVTHQLRVVLVRVAAKKTIIAFKSPTQWPAIIGAGGPGLLGRRQMPFAERISVVAILLQDLGKKAVLERDLAVGAREALGPFGDACHAVGVVIAPGQDTGARRRAQRGRVHIVVAQ